MVCFQGQKTFKEIWLKGIIIVQRVKDEDTADSAALPTQGSGRVFIVSVEGQVLQFTVPQNSARHEGQGMNSWDKLPQNPPPRQHLVGYEAHFGSEMLGSFQREDNCTHTRKVQV